MAQIGPKPSRRSDMEIWKVSIATANEDDGIVITNWTVDSDTARRLMLELGVPESSYDIPVGTEELVSQVAPIMGRYETSWGN